MFILLLHFAPMCAKFGCYTTHNTYKKPQPVYCLCPCKDTDKPTTPCIWCTHYHEPQNRVEIVTYTNKNEQIVAPNRITQTSMSDSSAYNLHAALGRLLTTYQNKFQQTTEQNNK